MLFCSHFTEAQTIVQGNAGQVMRAQMANEVKNTAMEAINLGRSKTAMVSALNQIRQQFWSEYQTGRVKPETQTEYLNLLSSKDMYIFMLRMQNVLHQVLGGEKGKVFDGPGDVIEYISGGKLDDGIPEYAYWAWARWEENCALIFEREITLRATMAEALENALNESLPLYQAYQFRRDLAEYLFYNPLSYLKSTDPKLYHEAWLLATNIAADPLIAREMSREVQAASTPGQFQQMISQLKANPLFSFETLQRQTMPYYSQAMADWYLAKGDENLLPLYLIKRRNGCTWAMAKEIHQLRIQRHGAANIAAIQNIAFNTQGLAKNACVGDPDLLIQQQIIEKKTPRLHDCIAEQLGGDSELWQDIDAYAGSHLNQAEIKANFQLEIQHSMVGKLPDSPAPELLYQQITEYLNESLLLNALYYQRYFGGQLIKAEYVNTNAGDLLKIPTTEMAVRLMEGLAHFRKDYRSAAVLALCERYHPSMNKTDFPTRILQAIQEYKKLEAQFGATAVTSAMSDVSPVIVPAYYPKNVIVSQTLKAKLADNAVPTSIKDQEKATADAEKQVYVTRYKNQFSKYVKNSNSAGKIFDNQDIAIYLKRCYNPASQGDSSAVIHVYCHKESAFFSSNTMEHIVRCQELFYPVVRLHCPESNHIYIEYYKTGFHLSDKGEVMTEAEFEEKVRLLKTARRRPGQETSEADIRKGLEEPFAKARVRKERGALVVCMNTDCKN